MNRVLCWAGMAAVAVAAAGLSAPAAFAAAVQPGERSEDSKPLYGKVTPEGYTARLLTRIATLDLRFVSVDKVGPRDFRIAAALYGLAEQMLPEDSEIVRRRYEAALSAGDTALALELTRRLALLDKQDEVSLLRLISGKIGALQTVEQRLSFYGKLLGPEGEALPPAIRSRLALDAALLRRERGEIDEFADLLAMAVRLDSTHKEAATLAATYYTDQVGDASGRMHLLLGLLYADPVDPNVHEAIAKLLARSGAWAQAKRFHDNGVALLSGPQGQLTDQLYVERQMLVWRTQGPQPVADALNILLEAVRKQAMSEAAQRHAEAVQEATVRGQQPPQAPRVDLSTVALPLNYERLRLLAAQAAGDIPTMEQSAANLAVIARVASEQAVKAAPDEATGRRAVRMAMLDLQTTRLWAGVQIARVEEFVAELGDGPAANPQEDMARRFVAGMLRLRQDDAAGAMEVLAGLPDDVYMKDVAMGLAYEQAGDRMQAVERYKRLAASPLSLPGAWALARLERLKTPNEEVFPEAAEMSAIAAGVSIGLDRMVSDPQAYMSLRVEPLSLNPGPIGEIGYLVSIRNTSPIPLSVGGDRVINTRLLFAPRMDAGNDRVVASAVPEVCEVDRKLRLEPGETMSAVVHPEYGWAGYSLEAAISRITKVRWRVLQGFGMGPRGTYESGATSLSTETPIVTRPALPETTLPVSALCDRIRHDQEGALPAVVAAIRSLLTGPQQADKSALLTDIEVSQIAEAARERYPSLSRVGRSMFLVALPPSAMVPPLKPFDDGCRGEEDPFVMALFLATRVNDSQDPTLAAAALSSDPMLGELARLLRDRLASGANSYARLPAPARAPTDGSGGQAPSGNR